MRCGVEAIGAVLRGREGSELSLALSGGSTPGPIYRELGRVAEIPWHLIRIYFADERAVPPDDPASNYLLVRQSLLDGLRAPAAAVHRMEAERADLDAAAAAYERLLPKRLDLLVLGVGEDGHTASLFPGSPILSEEVGRVAPAESPAPPRRRLTITPAVVRAARTILVLARGRAKAGAVSRALRGSPDVSSCPARLARGGTWVVDREAAALL